MLAGRYRLPPLLPGDYAGGIAYDTASGQDVSVRQVPLPEVVEAEFLDGAAPSGYGADGRGHVDPAVGRAVEAAAAASRIPDHPRLDQVYDVFVEGDGLWIVSELLPARPLSAHLAERPLSAHRAAEIAADLLAALRVVHAYGWTHRNITADSVYLCEDGRAILTGLALGAAQETLCGYAVLPGTDPGPIPEEDGDDRTAGPVTEVEPEPEADDGAGTVAIPGPRAGEEPGAAGELTPAGPGGLPAWSDIPLPEGFSAARTGSGDDGHGAPDAEAEARAARRGAVAAYRDGARRAAAERAGRPAPGEAVAAPDDGRTQASWWSAPGEERPRDGAAPGDEVGPASLPGARRPDSRPVPLTWPEHDEATPPATAPEHAEGAAPTADPGTGTNTAPGTGTSPRTEPAPHHDAYQGPASALAAERARQARMTVVGAVTERWAPEQAGPVYENWRLAPPVGPAADLWALGALLFRSVQGHSPYPEDGVAELVGLVCAEPPAFAEDCGPLRPVVESLLRQDPTERPDFEELRGWLRSLVRSAPEPEVGRRTVLGPPALDPGERSDPRRLPILRRRGELVRRRRAAKRPRGERTAGAPQAARAGRTRERKRPKAPPAPPPPPPPAPPAESVTPHAGAAAASSKRSAARERKAGSPQRLGRWLLACVLLGLGAAVLYAVLLMPKGGGVDAGGEQRRGEVGAGPETTAPDGDAAGRPKDPGKGGDAGTRHPQTSAPAVPDGYKTANDPAGFTVAVPEEWDRRSTHGAQVRYNGGQVEMVLVPGRDTVRKYGRDPMSYQSDDEPELKAYRASDWATTSGLRRIDVGASAMAEGTFTWRDGGRDVYARNRAMVLDGRYHVLLVMGSQEKRKEIDRHFEAVADTYRVTGG
nr:serine/threonine protein kinase [Streptomyces sp. HNM0574]